jgi:N6-adenosine-specific RNA methylase IME4
MSLDEIAALPVKNHAAPDCILWFWVTSPMLAVGAHIPIMKAWGFTPSAMGFVWIKLNPTAPRMFFMERDLAMGGGFTTRKNAEFLLIGKRGRSLRRDAGVHEVIISPRRQHSRKPDEAYERIERYSEGPRLELFARQQRSGWTCRGNETEKFIGGDLT